MSKTIEDMRELLFRTAAKLENAKPSDLDNEILRARGIGHLCQVLVDSAKVEVTREKVTGQQSGSRFLSGVRGRQLSEGDSDNTDRDNNKPFPRLASKSEK